jgi:uncharacterized protein (TIRG00374 family)
MTVKNALFGFGALTIFYVVTLLLVGSKSQVIIELPKLLSILPVLMGFSLLSYLVRYLRWYWLLNRAGDNTDVFFGFLAYLSGFAFTATPGKVGELMRIRYLTPRGVPPWRVLSAFVYERAFDLIAVLLLSALVIYSKDTNVFVFALVFVLLFVAGLLFAALNPAWLTKFSVYLRFHRLRRIAHICLTLRNGLSGCRVWATPLDILVSLVLGLLAASITSVSFVWLLLYLAVSIPILAGLAIYPLAMLAGAASMLPGGVGSTEVAVVSLLSLFDVPLGLALLAAVGIRFSTLWFAVICGFIALSILEMFYRNGDNRISRKLL